LKDLSALKNLIALEKSPDALLRMALLMASNKVKNAVAAAQRFALSNDQKARLSNILQPKIRIDFKNAKKQKEYLYRLEREEYLDQLFLSAAQKNISRAKFLSYKKLATTWRAPKFPVTGQDIITHGVLEGPEVGKILNDLENWWIKNDFRPTRSMSLNQLKQKRF
jgi:poly(A) polymerase